MSIQEIAFALLGTSWLFTFVMLIAENKARKQAEKRRDEWRNAAMQEVERLETMSRKLAKVEADLIEERYERIRK